MALLRNPCDQLEVSTLARQIFPKNSKFMIEAYNDATREKFGYLWISMHPLSEHCELKLFTKIFPGEVTEVFLPKNNK